MPSPTEAIYRGEVNFDASSGFCAGFYRHAQFEPGPHEVEFRHWRSADRRSEMVTMLTEGEPVFRWLTAEKGIAILSRGGAFVRLIETTASTGIASSGFYLPPEASRFFLVSDTKVANVWGDVCKGKEAGCQAAALGLEGSPVPVTVTQQGTRVSIPGLGHDPYVIQLTGLDQGYPKQITFVDRPNPKADISTHGELTLVAVKTSNRKSVSVEEFVGHRATLEIYKDGEAIGGEYSPGIHEPWKLHAQQMAFHLGLQQEVQSANVTLLTRLGGGLIVAGAVAAIYLGKRRS